MFGYLVEKATNDKIAYWDLAEKPADTDEHEYIVCDPADKPNLVIKTEQTYDPAQFIAWAISTFPSFIGTPHEYVVVQFGMNPAAFKDLMLERAQIIDTANGNTDFTDIANALIAKAIELGAEI